MNLIQIEYFMQLAENGSFRKTAELNYVSQPAVSKQISQLEREWGFKLFERGYRYASLTKSGEVMHAALRSCIDKYTDAMEHAKLQSKEVKSHISIGIPESSSMSNLPSIIENLRAENPHMLVHVKYVPLSMLKPKYPNGAFDMVICYDRNLQMNDPVNSVRISRHSHLAFISKDHPICRGGIPKFEALALLPIYIPARSEDEMSVDYARYICAQHGFSPADENILPNVDSVLLALKMGFGYAVLDDMIDPPEKYNLVSIPTNVSFDIMLAWHKDNPNPAIPVCMEKLLDGLEIADSHRIEETFT